MSIDRLLEDPGLFPDTLEEPADGDVAADAEFMDDAAAAPDVESWALNERPFNSAPLIAVKVLFTPAQYATFKTAVRLAKRIGIGKTRAEIITAWADNYR